MRIQEEGERARDTHELESASGRTSKDTKRGRTSEGHSHPGDHIGRAKSGHEKDVSSWRPLTCCRAHREKQVKKQKDSE